MALRLLVFGILIRLLGLQWFEMPAEQGIEFWWARGWILYDLLVSG